MDTLFRVSNLLVLPLWGLMILLPRWRWTERIVRSPLVSVAPALVYVALVLPRLGTIKREWMLREARNLFIKSFAND